MFSCNDTPLARRLSTLVGLKHTLNNIQWSITPYGASVDSSLFSFGGLFADNFAENLENPYFFVFLYRECLEMACLALSLI